MDLVKAPWRKKSINATFNQGTLVKKVPMTHLTKEPWKKGSMLHLTIHPG